MTTEHKPTSGHDDKGFSEEKCLRCGWVMGQPPLNCNNDDTPHRFPSQQSLEEQLEAAQGTVAKLRAGAEHQADAEYQRGWLSCSWIIDVIDDSIPAIERDCTNCDGLGHNTGWPHTTCPVCAGSGSESAPASRSS